MISMYEKFLFKQTMFHHPWNRLNYQFEYITDQIRRKWLKIAIKPTPS